MMVLFRLGYGSSCSRNYQGYKDAIVVTMLPLNTLNSVLC